MMGHLFYGVQNIFRKKSEDAARDCFRRDDMRAVRGGGVCAAGA